MTFDKNMAVGLAEMIAALYAGRVQPNLTCPQTDTQVLVAKQSDGTFAVIFPGTASVADWRTDFKVHKHNFYGLRVHRGFADAYDSIHLGLIELLPPQARIILAGHSLGGALATLAAVRLRAAYDIQAVYTFGSPRVGNGAFARHYNAKFAQRTFRVVNSGDPVPHIPWVFGTYRHVVKQVYLNADGRIVVDQFLAAVVAEARGACAAYVDREHLGFALAKPHAISSYIQKLNQGELA